MSRVAVCQCPDYNQSFVDAAVDRCLTLVEAEQLFCPGDNVLLKVNLLSARAPEQAVTTHPALVAALVSWFANRGARVWVGDSSGGISTAGSGSNTEQALAVSGVAAAAARAGAIVLNFDRTGAVPVGGGKFLAPVLVAKPVLQADLVVSVPKLKTHGLTLFTGAVKNMFGVVPGAAKAEYHRRAPTIKDFSQALVDVFMASRPGLAVMDAVTGMEGNGPSAGNPRQRGLVLASRDSVAIDAVACNLIGCPPAKVHTTVLAAAQGLGQMEGVEVVGDRVEPVRFRLPPSALVGAVAPRLSGFFLGLLAYLPVLDPETCTNCNVCVDSCPVSALKRDAQGPRLSVADCIRCYCCHELCPRQAIDLVPRYPGLRRALAWLSKRRRN